LLACQRIAVCASEYAVERRIDDDPAFIEQHFRDHVLGQAMRIEKEEPSGA